MLGVKQLAIIEYSWPKNLGECHAVAAVWQSGTVRMDDAKEALDSLLGRDQRQPTLREQVAKPA